MDGDCEDKAIWQVEQAPAKGRVHPLTWMSVLVLALRKLDELEGNGTISHS